VRVPTSLSLMSIYLRRGTSTVDWPRERLHREGPARGIPVLDADACTSCGACAVACPAKCIGMSEGSRVPVVDCGPCVRCGKCVTACKEGALALSGQEVVAVYSRGDMETDGRPPEARDASGRPGKLYRMAIDSDGARAVDRADLLEARSRQLGLK
jgi:formate hydrogenlyase subunit 6/NADH:ubiquinone oxidoreductase subunit I